MTRSRLDVLIVERGLAPTRTRAQALIMAGRVRVDGEIALKPAVMLEPEALIQVDEGPPFVSRAGEKLDAALSAFGLDVSGLVCADVGASTGGFTDCLLQRGAAKVYAIDVGRGLIDWGLRNDPRVVLMEQTNARFLESLPEPVGLVTIDASFISLRVLLPVVKTWSGVLPLTVVPLIKPQFEAGRREVARGSGVIRDALTHHRVLLEVLTFAQAEGLAVRGLIRSPLHGPKGNVEFLAWLVRGGEPSPDLRPLVEGVLI